MRSLLILIALLWTVSGQAREGFFVEVGVGKNGLQSSNRWEDMGGAGCYFGLGYAGDFTKSLTYEVAWRHTSQCETDVPDDGLIESNNDNIAIYGRYWF